MNTGAHDRRVDTTSEHERVSKAGEGFGDSPRHVLAGGPDDDQREAMGNAQPSADPELADEELVRRIKDAERQLRDGSARVFYDATSLIDYWERRAQG